MYIGSTYIDINENIMDSYDLQIGFVGPSVKMERVQKVVHDIIGAHEPPGWDEQIRDEFILQFNYERRWYQALNEVYGFKRDIIYYAGCNLGNASTKGVGGFLYRIGNKNFKDFGYKRIDYRGYNNIPLNKNIKYDEKYIYDLLLWAEGGVVLKDIFLDGNTFKDSPHTVDKEYFVAKGGFGFSIRYKKFEVDYIKTFSTKEFKTQSYYHNYGSLVFSYHY
jgi:hypothetical protein